MEWIIRTVTYNNRENIAILYNLKVICGRLASCAAEAALANTSKQASIIEKALFAGIAKESSRSELERKVAGIIKVQRADYARLKSLLLSTFQQKELICKSYLAEIEALRSQLGRTPQNIEPFRV